jgi:hypothetical protein
MPPRAMSLQSVINYIYSFEDEFIFEKQPDIGPWTTVSRVLVKAVWK